MEPFARRLGGRLKKGQVVLCRYDGRMPKVSRQGWQAGLHVHTGAIPAPQHVNREGETQVVDAGRPSLRRENAGGPNHLA